MKVYEPPKNPSNVIELAEATAYRLWTDSYIGGLTMQDTRVRAVYRIMLAKMQDAYAMGQKRGQAEAFAEGADIIRTTFPAHYGSCADLAKVLEARSKV